MRKACERSKKGPRKVRGKALPVAYNGYFKLTDSAVIASRMTVGAAGFYFEILLFILLSSRLAQTNSLARIAKPSGMTIKAGPGKTSIGSRSEEP
jgi:hypothetical protein